MNNIPISTYILFMFIIGYYIGKIIKPLKSTVMYSKSLPITQLKIEVKQMYNITVLFEGNKNVYLVGQTDDPIKFVDAMAKHQGYKELKIIGLKDNGFYYWNGIYSILSLIITAKPIVNISPTSSLFLALTGNARYYL